MSLGISFLVGTMESPSPMSSTSSWKDRATFALFLETELEVSVVAPFSRTVRFHNNEDGQFLLENK